MSLVLMRRVGEEVIIGGLIKVLVQEIRGKNVMLSIDAPKNISVDRTEVYLMKEQKKLNLIE